MQRSNHTTRGLVDRLLGRLDARIQRKHLRALSDHQLRDIGIVCSQVDEAFDGKLDPFARR